MVPHLRSSVYDPYSLIHTTAYTFFVDTTLCPKTDGTMTSWNPKAKEGGSRELLVKLRR